MQAARKQWMWVLSDEEAADGEALGKDRTHRSIEIKGDKQAKVKTGAKARTEEARIKVEPKGAKIIRVTEVALEPLDESRNDMRVISKDFLLENVLHAIERLKQKNK